MAPLVTTDWLGEQLHDEDIRVVDTRFYLAEPTRGRSEYEAGHIPGSRYLSLDDDLTGTVGPGRHPLPEPARFAAKLEGLGIGDHHQVVVYDQHDASIAARLWWMLRSLGHESVVVLDGGWEAWVAEFRSTTTEVPVWDTSELNLASEWSGTIERGTVADGTERLFLIDARAPERHRGEIEPIDPIAGHIPGSFNIPYQGNTDESGRFLPVEQLQERYAAVDTSARVVCYCGSGVTACSNILAMAIAGIEDALLYPGSWSGWIEGEEK
ncbi:MAG: sulfurtransferase [Acidimicrobiia bacterium]|nr:sulfurtransferase [Acidimicrobiia bacterium]